MKKLLLSLSCMGIVVPAITVAACTSVNTVYTDALKKVQNIIDSTEASFKSAILAKSEGFDSRKINEYVLNSYSNVVTNLESNEKYEEIKKSMFNTTKFESWSNDLKLSDGDYIGESSNELMATIVPTLNNLLNDFGISNADELTDSLSNLSSKNKLNSIDNELSEINGLNDIFGYIGPILEMFNVSSLSIEDFSSLGLKTNADLMLNAQVEIVNLLKVLANHNDLIEVKDFVDKTQEDLNTEFKDLIGKAMDELNYEEFEFVSLLGQEPVKHIRNILVSFSAYISTFDEYVVEDPVDGNHVLDSEIDNYNVILENNKKDISFDNFDLDLSNVTSMLTNLFSLDIEQDNFNLFRNAKILFTYNEKSSDFDFYQDFLKIGNVGILGMSAADFAAAHRGNNTTPFAAFSGILMGKIMENMLPSLVELPEISVMGMNANVLINMVMDSLGIGPAIIGVLFNILHDNDMESFFESLDMDDLFDAMIRNFMSGMAPGFREMLAEYKETAAEYMDVARGVASLFKGTITNLFSGSDWDSLIFPVLKGMYADQLPDVVNEIIQPINTFKELFEMNVLTNFGIQESVLTFSKLTTDVFENPAFIPMIRKITDIITALTSNKFIENYELKDDSGKIIESLGEYNYDLTVAIALIGDNFKGIAATLKEDKEGMPSKLDKEEIVKYILGNYNDEIQDGTLYGGISNMYTDTTRELFKETLDFVNTLLPELTNLGEELTKNQTDRTHKMHYSNKVVEHNNVGEVGLESTITYEITYTTINGEIHTYQVKLKTDVTSTGEVISDNFVVDSFTRI